MKDFERKYMNELELRLMMALTYLNLSDSEAELLENILGGASITQVMIVDEEGVVVATHYEFIR